MSMVTNTVLSSTTTGIQVINTYGLWTAQLVLDVVGAATAGLLVVTLKGSWGGVPWSRNLSLPALWLLGLNHQDYSFSVKTDTNLTADVTFIGIVGSPSVEIAFGAS